MAAPKSKAVDLASIVQDAIKAQEVREEQTRTDVLNRVWVCRPSSVGNHATVLIECTRGEDARSREVPNSVFGCDGTADVLAKTVKQISEALSDAS